VTVAGDAFAARVGASLAVAHAVPALIVHSEKEYEDVAVQYAGTSSTAASVQVVGRDRRATAKFAAVCTASSRLLVLPPRAFAVTFSLTHTQRANDPCRR
jgi:predicted O-linked N-acetylglucosamine transferase (SPINDLY family)